MLGHHLLTFYRSLRRHPLYAVINVLGLAVGAAVFLVLWLDVSFETSFERWIPNASQIYAVRMTWMFPGAAVQSQNWTMSGLLDQLKTDFPGLQGARIWDAGGTIRQDRSTTEPFEIVDRDFFTIFDLPLAAGDRTSALSSSDDIVISSAMARKYFGRNDPLGKKLSVSLLGSLHEYRVTGVLRQLPKNTDFAFYFLVPLTPQMSSTQSYWSHWGSSSVETFLRFHDRAQAEALNAQFDGFTDRRAQHDLKRRDAHKNIRLRVVPMLSLHLIKPQDGAAIAALALVGLLTLMLAAVNYVNLATARAALRAREVAIRKVLGATAKALLAQFLIEAVITAAAAAILGLALSELALPLINAAGGLSLRLDYLGDQSVLPLLAAGTAVVGLSAGVYPALVLSRFSSAAVLASARSPGGGRAGRRVRQALVTAQFAIAITFMVGTAVILGQSRYLHHAVLGFRREGLILVTSFDNPDVSDSQRSTLLGLWRAVPNVGAVTEADIAPGVDEEADATTSKRVGAPGEGVNTSYVFVGPDFFATYGVRPIAGRLLDRVHGFDDAAPVFAKARPPEDRALLAHRPVNVVLNVAATRALGFPSTQAAVGQTFLSEISSDGMRPLTIVGVTPDVRMRTPRAPVPSTYYLQRSDAFESSTVGVRFRGADPAPVTAAMAAAWRRVVPGTPFVARTAQASLQDYYRSDDQRSRLFTVGAALAVAIGCVGLYGLASFDTTRRTKEIGIRKTLGASTSDIVRLLIVQLLRPVLFGNLIAWPLAYLAMRSWLAGFSQRIALGPQYFLAASGLTLLIALATVVGQAWSVARAEPAKALRDV